MNSDTLEICLDKVTVNEFFDEIRIGRFTRISFHRTLRIPEDGRDYPLPSGLGRFPIHRVEDYSSTVPAKWLLDGGFFIPLYQKEALFLQFEGPTWHPTIAKVCVGKINAISGKPYNEALSAQNQDYLVIPNQSWLDGICSGPGVVRQFVAMPLGQGYTIESQITDEEEFGGFQIVAFESVSGRFPDRDPAVDEWIRQIEEYWKQPPVLMSSPASGGGCREVEVSMGIAAGGNIKQQIQKDTYGVETWNTERRRSLTIHLVNSLAYKAITGFDPPSSPITSVEYQRAKIPWYSHYDETAPVVKPPSVFKRILGVTGIEKKRGIAPSDDAKLRNLAIAVIHKIRTPDKNEASSIYRKRAYESQKEERWDSAIREISYVIDLNVDVLANDFALRSCCNYYLGRFKDGSMDGSLGLVKDHACVEALSWGAFCRKSLGDHEQLAKDANRLMRIPKTELLGLELKAEAALLAGRYADACSDAKLLMDKDPGNVRAEQIFREATQEEFLEIFGRGRKKDDNV